MMKLLIAGSDLHIRQQSIVGRVSRRIERTGDSQENSRADRRTLRCRFGCLKPGGIVVPELIQDYIRSPRFARWLKRGGRSRGLVCFVFHISADAVGHESTRFHSRWYFTVIDARQNPRTDAL